MAKADKHIKRSGSRLLLRDAARKPMDQAARHWAQLELGFTVVPLFNPPMRSDRRQFQVSSETVAHAALESLSVKLLAPVETPIRDKLCLVGIWPQLVSSEESYHPVQKLPVLDLAIESDCVFARIDLDNPVQFDASFEIVSLIPGGRNGGCVIVAPRNVGL